MPRESVERLVRSRHQRWWGGWRCAYDVTALYFEAEREDELRKVGYSKVRRVDPQAIVGARQVRALGDLETHFHGEGDAFTDG